MKKSIALLLICALFLSFLLCGCDSLDLFTTQKYRQMKSIYTQAQIGLLYTKEALFQMLGYPEGYRDSSGQWARIDYQNQEASKETLFLPNTVQWSYTCYRLRGPSDPYSLRIYFNESGQSIQVEFEVIYGG